MFKKMLVPLDGTEEAQKILPYASKLARSLNIQVVLLSVIDPLQRSKKMEEKVKGELEAVVKRLAQQGVEAEPVVVYDDRPERIVRVAERKGCDLIAMATHARTALGRLILGSVTDEVIRASHIPTLTINVRKAEKALKEPDIARTMVLLDGSALAETALPYAEELAQKLTLEILLVRLVFPGELRTTPWDEARTLSPSQIEAEAAEYLEGVAKRLEAKGLKVQSQVIFDYAGGAVARLTHDAAQDVIIMATHGRSGLARWIMGSATGDVLRASGEPLLVIPPKQAA